MKTRRPRDDSLISCPRCRRPNPAALVYCAVRNCAAVLHPGRIACGACRAAIPINARFCRDCGQATGYGAQSGTVG